MRSPVISDLDLASLPQFLLREIRDMANVEEETKKQDEDEEKDLDQHISSKRKMRDMANVEEETKKHDEDEDEDGDSDEYEYIEPLPRHEITQEEKMKYYSQVIQSKGFDVEKFDGGLCEIIAPCRIDETNEQLVTDLSKQALQLYNEQNNASFEFDRLVKVNRQLVAGRMYYITFTALSGSTSQTFRGKVWHKLFNQAPEVQFCEMV